MKISHVRKIMIKSHFGLIMAIAILLVSCTKDKTIGDLTTPKVNDNITSSARAQGTTDEDVFQGVMFLEGPVAAKLSDLNDFNIRNLTSDQQQIQNALDFQKLVIKTLKNNNPSYLKNFRAKIGSGDYYTVKAAIDQASNDIFNITLLSTGKSKDEVVSNAKTLSDNFKSKHHLSEASSKEEILAALKLEIQPKNSVAKVAAPPSIAISVYVYAYTGLVIAIMIMLVLTVGIAQEGGAGGIGRTSSNNFLNESFLSEVTLNLSHI
jgi:hypothetical protein